jgi:hypothetical protein
MVLDFAARVGPEVHAKVSDVEDRGGPEVHAKVSDQADREDPADHPAKGLAPSDHLVGT